MSGGSEIFREDSVFMSYWRELKPKITRFEYFHNLTDNEKIIFLEVAWLKETHKAPYLALRNGLLR